MKASGLSLRVALGQMRVYPADVARNYETVADFHRRAADAGADLLVLPEMALPGYMLGDHWERDAFLGACEKAAADLVALTRQSATALLFGTVGVDWQAKGEDGRPRKFNAFVFAQNGEVFKHPATGLGFGIKTLHPNYREFDDTRYFMDTRRLALESGRPLGDWVVPVPWILGRAGEEKKTVRLGVHLCEDAWQDDYAQKPLDILAAAGADFFVNLSASPFTRGKNGKRNRVFGALAKNHARPMVYVNAVSLQNNAKTVYTFDGSSTLYAGDGSVALEMGGFVPALGLATVSETRPGHLAVSETEVLREPEQTEEAVPPRARAAHRQTADVPDLPEMHRALRFGIREFLRQAGLSKVVVGVSGGIDSAVSAALLREILPPEQVLLVNMPSRFNSRTTRDLAEELAARLGCPYLVLPIDEAVALTERQIHRIEARVPERRKTASPPETLTVTLKLEGLGLENVQARDRGARLLAAVAAAFGGVFVCNTNKAEMTVGYGTLYGDIAGFLAPLADLWKREVYALGHYLNDAVYKHIVIPEGIFTVVPSAELSAAQAVDEGKGDPLIYPYHDRLFFAFVQRWRRASPEDVLTWYAEKSIHRELGLPGEVDVYRLFPSAAGFIADLEKWWRLYQGLGVVKRLQAPPVLAISSRAFGFDHRESLLPVIFSEAYLALKAKLLAA